ncbi:MAG: hypothetical protein SGI74_02790 [Oligoflexia bacterium]|nr:hypothetical protein [Oligoflexia bacterium]
MIKRRILFAVVVCLICSTNNNNARAQATDAPNASSSSSENSGDENSFGKRPDGFILGGGLNWGIGTGASSTGSTASRTMNTIELNAAPGWQIGNWAPQLLVAYDFVGQNTKPADVTNTNLRGTGYLIGVGTTYHWTRWDFLAGIEFLGTFTQSEKSADDKVSAFTKPLGFRLGSSYYFKNNWSADALFHYVHYSTNTLGGSNRDISSDRMRFITLALGVSYHL